MSIGKQTWIHKTEIERKVEENRTFIPISKLSFESLKPSKIKNLLFFLLVLMVRQRKKFIKYWKNA